MRGPEDHVQRRGEGSAHGRHRRDRGLVPLARAEQAEAQDHQTALQVEVRLDGVGIDERQARHAVRHDPDAPRLHAVGPREQGGGRPGHDDGRGRHAHELRQDPPLGRRRRSQHGVQRRHDGHVQGADEVEHVGSIVAAPDAVLVLDRDDLDVRRVQGGGRSEVVAARVTADPVADHARVGRRTGDRVQGHDLVGPTDDARSLVNVAIPQRCGGYVETNAVAAMRSSHRGATPRGPIGPRRGRRDWPGRARDGRRRVAPSAASRDSRSRDSTTRRSPCSRGGPWGRPQPRR